MVLGGFTTGQHSLSRRPPHVEANRLPICSMRSIGLGERAIQLMLLRVTDPRKKTFGKELYRHGSVMDAVALSRIELDAARMLVYSAAHQIDLVRPKGAMKSIGMAKALIPGAVNVIIDRAMQVHGGEGICQDSALPAMFAGVRTLRWADGPDEVHRYASCRSYLFAVAALTPSVQFANRDRRAQARSGASRAQ